MGAPGGTLPAGTADGELLYYDNTTALWVISAAPGAVGGVIPEWDPATGLYAFPPQTLGHLSFGAQNILAAASSFFGAGSDTTSSASIAAAGAFILPFDCTIDNFGAYHANTALGTANPVTYFVNINGADTALTVSQNTNAAGPVTDLANSVAYTAFSRLVVRASWLTAALQGIRPSFTMRLLARNVTVL